MKNEKLKKELERYYSVGTSAKNNILYWFPQAHTEEDVILFYEEVQKNTSKEKEDIDVAHYINTMNKILDNKKLFAEICESCGYPYNVLIKNAQSAVFTVEIPFDKSVVEKRRIVLEMIYDSTKYSNEMFLADLKQAILKDQSKTQIHRIHTNAFLQAINNYALAHQFKDARPYIRIVK